MKQSIIRPVFTLLFVFLFIHVYAANGASQKKVYYMTISDIPYFDQQATDLDPYQQERCKLDITYPSGGSPFATVIWFHGGGLSSGEKFIPAELTNQGLAIVAVNYRLYPKVAAPVYIEDAAQAVAWVMKNIQRYGGDPSLIFVAGHSAGGYLTSMIGLDKRWLAKHGENPDQLAGLIPYSGHTITHFTVREERGIPGEQPIVDDLAPLYHVRKDAPPLILITGDRELELLGRYEENAYLMRMMKVVGHSQTRLFEIQGFDHGAMVVPAHHILLNEVKRIISDRTTGQE